MEVEMPGNTNTFEGFTTGTMADMPAKNAGKRILVLFIVDATKSMEGPAIGQVNYALSELFSDLQSFASDNVLNMELAIISFSNSIKWEMEPEDINNCFALPQINVRPGNTQYGVVYNELNKRLNKNDLLKSTGKQAPPVLVFLTDGAPVDDYKYDMEQLRKNGYFMLANRSAVIMGEGANDPDARTAVTEFTLDENMVLTTDSTAKIVDTIKLATMHTIKGTEFKRPVETPPSSDEPFNQNGGNEGGSVKPPGDLTSPFSVPDPASIENPFDLGNTDGTTVGTTPDSSSILTGNPFDFGNGGDESTTESVVPESPGNPFLFNQSPEEDSVSGLNSGGSPFENSETGNTDPDDLFADLEGH